MIEHLATPAAPLPPALVIPGDLPEAAFRHRLLETHHRIKNHLQLVSSMLELQARQCRSAEARSVLRAAEARVLAIARLQRWAEREGDARTVDLGIFLQGYCDDLAGVLLGGDQRPCPQLSFRIAPLEVASSHAVTLALIVAELVTNAVKHAQASAIHTEWAPLGGAWRLAGTDDGRGLPPRAFKRSSGSGARLLAVMAHSLGGTLEVRPGRPGTSVTVVFPAGAALF